jgi:hypothetical protein
MIDIHVDSGLSTLKHHAETGDLCGFELIHAWPVDPKYESFEVPPKIWYKACGEVANEEASNDEEAMVIFRSLSYLFDYHVSHYHATLRGYDKIMRYFVMYVDHRYMGKGTTLNLVQATVPISCKFYIHGRVSGFFLYFVRILWNLFQFTFPNSTLMIEKINSQLSNGARVVIDAPFLPYKEIDFSRGSRRVFDVQDSQYGQLCMSILPPAGE